MYYIDLGEFQIGINYIDNNYPFTLMKNEREIDKYHRIDTVFRDIEIMTGNQIQNKKITIENHY